MKLFGEKVKHTFTNSPHNILQIKDYNEIFFDVYEIELNNGKYPVEKISEESGMPVVSIPIIVEGVEREVSFVLTKGKENIIFLNEENENLVNSSDLSEKSTETVEMHIDIPQILREDVEEVDQPLSHIQESKREILDQIEEAKKQAIKQASKIKKRKLEEANSEISEKKKALDVMLESARNSLVDEFLDISKKIKNEFISENDNRWEEIQETIDNKIEDISSSLSESLKEDFSTSEKQFDGKIRELVKELYNSLQPKIDNDLKDIAKQIVEKVNVIENNLTDEFEKIDERFQKNLSNVEENITEIALDMSGKVNSVKSELNEKFNKIDKNVNKSLSRVGLLDKKIDTAVYTISEEIDNKIQQVENDIEKSCNDKLELLESKNFDINDKNRKYLIDLITESKHGLIEEVRKISKQAPIEYVVEANNTKKNINQDDIIKDLEKKINFLVGDVETRLRKYVAVYGGGGGTVATQYQDGGIMNGDLTINGNTTFNGNNTIDGNSSITGNVSIEGAITSIDSIQFDKAASITVEQGELAWNAEDLTLDLGLDTNVTLQLGQEQVIRVKCADPLGVFDGMPVYAYGTTGGSDNIEIKRYSSAADYGVDELYFIGVATENIAFNGVGFVTTFGRVREVDGRAYGTNNGVKDPADSGNWVFGDVLYVSPNIAGTLTRIIPESPDARIPVAMVLKAPNQRNITLMVRAEHGYHLTELHDVYARTPNNGDVLAYNASNSRWENTSNISVSSLSATTIHALSSFVEVIDIKQYELSGFNVRGNATVQGSISATGDLIVDTDTLYVDSADSRVGIGTDTPSEALTVSGNISASGNIIVGGNINNAGSDVVFDDDVQFDGTENTMPNQTLDAGDSSVMTSKLFKDFSPYAYPTLTPPSASVGYLPLDFGRVDSTYSYGWGTNNSPSYFLPFLIRGGFTKATFDHVAGTHPTAVMEIAVYNMGSNGLPTTLVDQQTASLSATGLKTVTFTSPIQIDGMFYVTFRPSIGNTEWQATGGSGTLGVSGKSVAVFPMLSQILGAADPSSFTIYHGTLMARYLSYTHPFPSDLTGSGEVVLAQVANGAIAGILLHS